MSMEGFIYAVHFTGVKRRRAPFIKIGFSIHPLRRIRHGFVGRMQWRSPFVIATTPATIRDEQRLHMRLVRGLPPGHPAKGREVYSLNVLADRELPFELVQAFPGPIRNAVEQSRYQTDHRWAHQLIENAISAARKPTKRTRKAA